MTGTDLIQRASLDAILAHRDRALALANDARALHKRQQEEMAALVRDVQGAVSGATVNQSHLYKLEDHIKDRYDSDEKFAAKIRRDLDAAIWPALLQLTGMGGMMDKEARDDFDRQLSSEPPECTEETIKATFRQLKEDGYRIFRRGLVNVFKRLSRDYRSNDGFKLGPRTVVHYGVSEYRSQSDYHTFADADRIMHILDGRKIGAGWYSPLAERLCNSVRTEWKTRNKWSHSGESVIIPGEVQTAYWRAKYFQNKNVHLWCLRPDLLRRANRIIAEFYEENSLGEGPDAAGARRYTRAKPHHHDVEDFYPTPPPVVARLIRAARLTPDMDVLEPSAGNGAVVKGLLAIGITPDAYEIDSGRADTLRDMLPPGAVMEMDFLRANPEPEYDRVLMNPPFGKGAGVQHVLHAERFLKPGGRLVAVLGAGLLHREDGPTLALRRLVRDWGGGIEPLPAGSFRAAGTDVDTVLVAFDKPEAALPALPAPAADDAGQLALGAD